MADKSKKSTSSQPVTAPLATVEGSLLANTTNTNYLAFISANAAAARLVGQQSQDTLGTGEDFEDEEDLGEVDFVEEGGPEVEEGPTGRVKSAPNLSDITVVSNEVVYDAANNPTSKVVFKIRNSSGEILKAVNVKVEKK